MTAGPEAASTDLHGESALVPPRPLAVFVLAASGLAVLVVGAVATLHLLLQLTVPWDSIPARHWGALAAAVLLTLASLGVRSLRWVFLLRRTQTYVPLRDSIFIYLSGLSLIFVPLLAGETFLRALVARQRRVAAAETVFVVNYWERALDVLALGAIAGVAGLAAGGRAWPLALLAVSGLGFVPSARRAWLAVSIRVARLVSRPVFGGDGTTTAVGERRLAMPAAFAVAMLLSLLAWALPGLALWGLARAWHGSISWVHAQEAFAAASLFGGAVLAPGGVFIVGASLIARLGTMGLDASAATLVVFGLRLATTGFAIVLGALFVAYHLARRPARDAGAHFDAIAEVYDAQIPEARRVALVERKTALMDRVLSARARGHRGLDAGCGQGHYVARLRELGYDVVGIDDSPLQVERARARFAGLEHVFSRGSVLQVPFPTGRFDFACCINVLHHLDSFESQRQAFAELARVLRPGGLLFLHEINTRNWLFRFYMGYLFPALNCIDEGVEHWLLPHRLEMFTDLPLRGVEYFTFLPDFLPPAVVRGLAPLERRLEASRLGQYSAHFMAVFEKGDGAE